MTAYAGRVNQKHYHAALLLALQAGLDDQDSVARARYQALEEAALDALLHAWRLFLLELAQSCQIAVPVQALEQLVQALGGQDRSHAVVNTLLTLQAEPQSWLRQLLDGENGKWLERPPAVSRKAGNLLLSSDAMVTMPLQAILQQFQDFVIEQREFLQEW